MPEICLKDIGNGNLVNDTQIEGCSWRLVLLVIVLGLVSLSSNSGCIIYHYLTTDLHDLGGISTAL